MDILLVLYILLCHWVADFVLQTDKQAQKKSKSNLLLTEHVVNYTAFMFLMVTSWASIVFGIDASVLFLGGVFGVVTFTMHWCTDWLTSRLNKKLWVKGDIHNFFVSVGFDQFLHFAQLLITYKLLFG